MNGACSFLRAWAALGTHYGPSLSIPSFHFPRSRFFRSLIRFPASTRYSGTLERTPLRQLEDRRGLPLSLRCSRHGTRPAHAFLDHSSAFCPVHRRRIASHLAPTAAAGKMDEGDRSIRRSLAAQEPIVRELLQEDVEHGVLIPLKTTLELRDDYQTGHVLITRTPTKAANPAILYVRRLAPFLTLLPPLADRPQHAAQLAPR